MSKTVKFKTFKNENLSDKVANEIIQMVHDGKLKAGEKLPPEPELATEFGISRGVLREALTILSAKGYIRRTPGYGTFIRDLPEIATDSDDSLHNLFKIASYNDILELRSPLEELCVQLVVERASDREIETLYKEITDLSDKGLSAVANFNFHLRLSELTKNVLLINLMSSYSDLINDFAHEMYVIDDRYKISLREHIHIMEEIRKRDVKSAKEAMKKHLAEANAMLLKK